jgi:hypothetical protein
MLPAKRWARGLTGFARDRKPRRGTPGLSRRTIYVGGNSIAPDNKQQRAPIIQVHIPRGRYDQAAAIGSIRVGSLFFTFPTRVLTGQQVISSDGYGARRALSSCGSDGSSPSQARHASRPMTAGIRLCSSAHSSLGFVVMTAKLRTHSPAGERQFSHSPASAIKPRSARATA